MQFIITLEDKDRLLQAFSQAPAVAAKEFGNALGVIASTVTSHAIRNAPVGKNYSGGGNLRQSITQGRSGTGYIVSVNSAYGAYVDQGTRPHVILPRRSKFLAFQKDGQWVFARRVNHPGTKPTFFFTHAVEEGQSIADSEMQKAMDTVVRSITE